MERVRDAASVSNSTCVACTAPLSSDHRCGHCGAAQRAGPYRVLKVLSRSQHGAMYLAEDEAGAKVALKELVFSLVPSAQELDAFHREAALLKALSHPRIPKFLASFTEGSGVSTRLYLAQQFLSGRSLTQQLETEHFDEGSCSRSPARRSRCSRTCTALQLITGLRGSISRLELMRGLMQASGPAPCSYSGVRLEED